VRLCSVLNILCVCTVPCNVSPFAYCCIVTIYLQVTDHCQRLETQLQQTNIFSYRIISQRLCNPRHMANNPNDIPRSPSGETMCYTVKR
jgi:hypothetical protein